MDNKVSTPGQTIFEQIKRVDENKNEFWTARDLSSVLEYSEYRHFKAVIDRAKEACKKSGNAVADHFEELLGMVAIGSGAERQIEDVKLSRYACYLIVQNGSPEKEIVALGQTYFAVQTRIREIQQMEEFQQLQSEKEKRLFLRKEMAEHNESRVGDAPTWWNASFTPVGGSAQRSVRVAALPAHEHCVGFNATFVRVPHSPALWRGRCEAGP